MRLHPIGRQHFIALFVVSVALAAVVLCGLHGLNQVASFNRQVFSDNLETTQATSTLASDLSRVQADSLELFAIPAGAPAEQLHARLVAVDIPAVNADIETVLRLHAQDAPAEAAQITRIAQAWSRFLATAHQQLATVPLPSQRAAGVSSITTALGALLALISDRQPIERRDAATAHAQAQQTYHDARSGLIVAAVLAVVGAAIMLRLGLTLNRILWLRDQEHRYEETASEFTAILQATENECEAHDLLRKQVERLVDSSRALVLARNNSDDRLESRTSLDALPELAGVLEGAAPKSCLAIRYGRSHEEGTASQPLTRCELCGALPGVSTCEPLLVSGTVIGSVLVNHVTPPGAGGRERIADAVAQAAPVLGNLRNLAIAELRAATDRLTGLANHRAVEDTFKRMVAQAHRSATPLAALLLDLDHFKQINDVYGHDRGNDVLAAVGATLRDTVRESDFVGRYGGEEFLILLPATDDDGALEVAQRIRAAIASIRIVGIERPITASLGVAVLPADGKDADALFRAADRALYAAKKAGRDRVCTADAQPDATDAAVGSAA